MKNPMGSNSFDRLQEAGLMVSGGGDEAQALAKIEARIARLVELDKHLAKVEVATANLWLLPKDKALTQLSAALKSTQKVMADKLPTGTKTPLTACMNELTSLREGVYLATATDKKALTLLFVTKARKEIAALLLTAKERKAKLEAASSDDEVLQKFYDEAAEVIEQNKKESEKLDGLKDKPFMIARVPVVPADNIVSVEKLRHAGFACESLGGYAVLKNQLVIGINPKSLTKKIKAPDEAERLRKQLQSHMKVPLQFVSTSPFSYKGASWFWLMSDRDINALTKTFPGGRLKVMRWGFAFN